MIVHAGRGSIVVKCPEEDLRYDLRRFRRNRDGEGTYEPLYTVSEAQDILVTMPGFADRIRRLCPDSRFIDERVPMPDPDIGAAMSDLEKTWCRVAADAIGAGGGVVAIPEILGSADIIAAILRAFPRECLLERGTPLSIIASKDRYEARALAEALRAKLGNRDIGVSYHGSWTDSEDVIITPYGELDDLLCNAAGILIGNDLPRVDLVAYADKVSMFRNAARWGICETAGGGCKDLDIAQEGLFGPVSASASYADSVEAGIGAPVTVCWLPCPKPNVPNCSADLPLLEAIAMQDNKSFVDMAVGIMRDVPGDVGGLMYSGNKDMSKRVSESLPGIVEVSRRVPAKDRRTRLADMASGTVRKAVLMDGMFPKMSSHGVMVMATCGGADAVQWFPWRRMERQGDKTYVVDFSHKWDVHNGRPGRLARNDEARTRRYAELGFSQMSVNDAAQLPFL